jgi:hypothetical protein
MEYVCERETKTGKQNREGYMYTEREKEKSDKERLGDREREYSWIRT